MVNLDHNSWKQIWLLLELVGLLAYLYRLVRANRKDRVLLCEALGVGIFLAGFLVFGLFRPPVWLFIFVVLVPLVFGTLALYFALLNWAERRVKKAKAK